MLGEVLVDATEPRYKVIFERVYCMFGRLLPMEARVNTLKVHRFVVKELFEGSRTFVVESLEFWS